MNAVGCSEFGDDAPALIARTRDIEEQARRVKRMVILDRPARSVLLALYRLRRDLNEFETLALEARLRRIFYSLSGGYALQPAVEEVAQILRQERRPHGHRGIVRRRAA